MPITIQPYDPGWPSRFEREAAAIREALGPVALRVDHIGSTAVRGLAAKDIIDILVSVASLEPESGYRAPLEQAGYIYRPDDDPQHRFFKRDGSDGLRLVNVHVCEAGGEWEARHLAFRDYLRANPKAAARYQRLKERLSAEHDDVLSYTDAKTDFISQAVEGFHAAPSGPVLNAPGGLKSPLTERTPGPMAAPEQAPCYNCDQNRHLPDLPPRSAVLVERGWIVAHTFDTPIRGRLVLLPLRHVESVSELTPAEAEALGQLLARLSRAVEAVTGCAKTWVLMLAELPGFAHLHFHIVPRPRDFVFSPGGPSVTDFLRHVEGDHLTDHERDEVALRLREALRQQG